MTEKAVRTGQFKEFARLFFPVMLIAFSSSIYLMVEKLLLGRFSTTAMEAAVTVAYIAQIFQLGTVAIAMMAQVFIGQQHGERNWKAMGPYVWQYVWFSLLSIAVVVPVGALYGSYYLKGMPFESIAKPYLYSVLFINFFYPMGTALSCFYIAQGKTKLVLFSTIGSQLLKVCLAYFFIPILTSKNPLWGLYGAAASTFLAQGLFVAVLFGVFLRPKLTEIYSSRNCRFSPKLFWNCVHPGLLRASNKILSALCGASIAHLMVSKTALHLLTFSIGGVIFFFLPFLSDAICQTQTVIVSQVVGSKNFPALFKAFKSGFLWCSIWIALFGIPLLMFPETTFHILFPKIELAPHLIQPIFWGIWISFAFFTLLYVPLGYILAFKDMNFSAFMGVFGWLNGFLFMYYLIEQVQIAPQYFWLALSLMHISNALIYFLRAKWLCSKATQIPLLS